MSELQVGRRSVAVEVKRFALDSKPGEKPWSGDAYHEFGDRLSLPDNVFLTDGKDVYVASRKGMNLGHKIDGKQVKLDGKAMTVFRSNDNPDTALQKVGLFFRMLPLMAESAFRRAFGLGNGSMF